MCQRFESWGNWLQPSCCLTSTTGCSQERTVPLGYGLLNLDNAPKLTLPCKHHGKLYRVQRPLLPVMCFQLIQIQPLWGRSGLSGWFTSWRTQFPNQSDLTHLQCLLQRNDSRGGEWGFPTNPILTLMVGLLDKHEQQVVIRFPTNPILNR